MNNVGGLASKFSNFALRDFIFQRLSELVRNAIVEHGIDTAGDSTEALRSSILRQVRSASET